MTKSVSGARASAEISPESYSTKVRVRELLDEARRTPVDLDELGGGRSLDALDVHQQESGLLGRLFSLVDEDLRAPAMSYLGSLSPLQLKTEQKILERVHSNATNVEQAKLAYLYLTSFQATSPRGERLTQAAKEALIEAIVRPSGPTDAGQIGVLTAADAQCVCIALDHLSKAELERFGSLIEGAGADMLRHALFLSALGARAHLFSERGREVDRKIAGVFEDGLQQSPLSRELDEVEAFGRALATSSCSDQELSQSQTLLHFARGPWEPNGIDDLFERHGALRDAGAVWISYASGCLPAALTLLTNDPIRRERLTDSIRGSEWLPQGLYADQIEKVLQEQNGSALPFLAEQLQRYVDWVAKQLEVEGAGADARELRALASGQKPLPRGLQEKYGERFSALPMPIRDMLQLVRSHAGVRAGDGINEYRAKDAAQHLLPLQSIEAWHFRGTDPEVLRRELAAHFANPDAGPRYIQPALQDAEGFLSYVTLAVTAYDAATGRMTIGGEAVPLEQQLDPDLVRRHALERSLPEFVRAFNVTFDFDPSIDRFIEALAMGHGTVLHIVDTAEIGSGGSGHWMAVLRTRPGADGAREFLVCDPKARYWLEWVPEPQVRDRSFLRAFTGFEQPMVSSVLVSRRPQLELP